MSTSISIKTRREVEEGWKCHRSGDCCRSVPSVVISNGEYEYLHKALTMGQLYKLTFRKVGEDGKFWEWVAAPCPMLNKGTDTCTIHEHRPYNCRRFGCLRPDPKAEPFQLAPLSPYLKYGNIGCANLRDRLIESRIARRMYELIQRKAQRWAVKYGWGPG